MVNICRANQLMTRWGKEKDTIGGVATGSMVVNSKQMSNKPFNAN